MPDGSHYALTAIGVLAIVLVVSVGFWWIVRWLLNR